ncbi:13944_t:CDS:2 [Acaulospora morrowiae]|uniref:13944_t:CDS:1 n=1 Tax=Acaulospora morrowiae TaxID=94023 RepID=A0A9N9EZJ4_9GLOM|nr:13944_t:CDS:2 [Acaulospora morrowiae]
MSATTTENDTYLVENWDTETLHGRNFGHSENHGPLLRSDAPGEISRVSKLPLSISFTDEYQVLYNGVKKILDVAVDIDIDQRELRAHLSGSYKVARNRRKLDAAKNNLTTRQGQLVSALRITHSFAVPNVSP